MKTLFWSLTAGKFMGMELATLLVPSSSLPPRTLSVAFSFGPFPPFVFPPVVPIEMKTTGGLDSACLLDWEPYLLKCQYVPVLESVAAVFY